MQQLAQHPHFDAAPDRRHALGLAGLPSGVDDAGDLACSALCVPLKHAAAANRYRALHRLRLVRSGLPPACAEFSASRLAQTCGAAQHPRLHRLQSMRAPLPVRCDNDGSHRPATQPDLMAASREQVDDVYAATVRATSWLWLAICRSPARPESVARAGSGFEVRYVKPLGA